MSECSGCGAKNGELHKSGCPEFERELAEMPKHLSEKIRKKWTKNLEEEKTKKESEH